HTLAHRTSPPPRPSPSASQAPSTSPAPRPLPSPAQPPATAAAPGASPIPRSETSSTRSPATGAGANLSTGVGNRRAAASNPVSGNRQPPAADHFAVSNAAAPGTGRAVVPPPAAPASRADADLPRPVHAFSNPPRDAPGPGAPARPSDPAPRASSTVQAAPPVSTLSRAAISRGPSPTPAAPAKVPTPLPQAQLTAAALSPAIADAEEIEAYVAPLWRRLLAWAVDGIAIA